MTKNQKSKKSGQVAKPRTAKTSEPKILLADDDSVSSDDESEDHNRESVNHHDSIIHDEDDESNDANSISDEEMESFEPSSTTLQVPTKETFQSDGKYHNKQRCLIICSRGITSRVRHLLEDLRTLIPHHKKDSKIDINKNEKGGIGSVVNDIAEMRGCNSVLFLECRKKQDAYLWLGHTKSASVSGLTSGPSAKFLLENIHTMDELRLTGNCMRGSRPILVFDPDFDEKEELKLLKCLFLDVFGTPRGHPKSKPFVDRVMGFYHADGKVSVVDM
jgi:RNA-binding protein required for 60S ribosomal subunit biogenesis